MVLFQAATTSVNVAAVAIVLVIPVIDSSASVANKIVGVITFLANIVAVVCLCRFILEYKLAAVATSNEKFIKAGFAVRFVVTRAQLIYCYQILTMGAGNEVLAFAVLAIEFAVNVAAIFW